MKNKKLLAFLTVAVVLVLVLPITLAVVYTSKPNMPNAPADTVLTAPTIDSAGSIEVVDNDGNKKVVDLPSLNSDRYTKEVVSEPSPDTEGKTKYTIEIDGKEHTFEVTTEATQEAVMLDVKLMVNDNAEAIVYQHKEGDNLAIADIETAIGDKDYSYIEVYKAAERIPANNITKSLSEYVNNKENQQNLTLYVVKYYRITLDTNGGHPLDPVDIPYDGTYKDVPIPRHDTIYYSNDGWYKEDGKFAAEDQKIDPKNHTLIANWYDSELRYDDSNKDFVAVTGCDRDILFGIVEIPTKYNGKPVTTIRTNAFNAKNTIKAVIIPDNVVTIEANAFANLNNATICLYAAEALPTFDPAWKDDSARAIFGYNDTAHTYKFDVNGGYAIDDIVVGGLATLPKAYKDDFVFAGWYDNAALDGKPVSDIYYSNAETTTLYPKWIESQLTITAKGRNYAVSGVKDKTLTSAEIPFIYKGKPVVGIEDNAFRDCTSLVDINIPDSITSIGANAMNGCSALENIKLPDSIKFIGEAAFANCTSLSSAVLPQNMTKISNRLFEYCMEISQITLPTNLTSIGDYAFKACFNMYSFDLGTSLTEIGVGAFETCTRLNAITIPEGVRVIKKKTFVNCIELTNVHLANSIEVIEESAFSACEALTNINIPNKLEVVGVSVFEKCANLSDITLPDSVAYIADRAFYNCGQLGEINLAKVKNFGSKAFFGCALRSIDLSSANSIGYQTFMGCAISDITYTYINEAKEPVVAHGIPGNVMTIGDEAFMNCGSLEKMTFGYGIVSIGDNAFNGAFAIHVTHDIVLPSSVASIGTKAFANDTTIANLVIPFSVNYVGSSILDSNTRCTIHLATTVPTTWETDWNSSSCTVKEYKTDTNLHMYTFDTDGGTEYSDIITRDIIALPTPTKPGYKFMGWYENEDRSDAKIEDKYYYSTDIITVLYAAFVDENLVVDSFNCVDEVANKNITSIDIPAVYNGKYIEGINNLAFADCKNLTSVSLPSSSDFRYIGAAAFSGCTSLNNIFIPLNVTHIYRKAFENCAENMKIFVAAEEAAMTLEENWNPNNYPVAFGFDGNMHTYSLYDGEELVDTISTYGFVDLDAIDMPFKTGKAFLGWDNGGEVYLRGKFYSNKDVRLDACYDNNVQYVKVSSIVGTNTRNYNNTLTNISISTMEFTGYPIYTVIGDNGFNHYTHVMKVNIEEGITEIGANAFNGCANLRSVTLPSTLETIGEGAFSGCSKLEQIFLPASVKNIGINAFKGCTNLKIYTTLTEIPTTWVDGWNADNRPVALDYDGIVYTYTFIDGESRTVIESDDIIDLNLVEVTNHINFMFLGWSSTIEGDGVYYNGNLYKKDGATLYAQFKPLKVENGMVVKSDDPNDAKLCSMSGVYPEITVGGQKVGVTGIGDRAFEGYTNLATFHIWAGIETIGESAFDGCSNLRWIYIPDTVTYIGANAFRGCPKDIQLIVQDGENRTGWDPNWNPDGLTIIWY